MTSHGQTLGRGVLKVVTNCSLRKGLVKEDSIGNGNKLPTPDYIPPKPYSIMMKANLLVEFRKSNAWVQKENNRVSIHFNSTESVDIQELSFCVGREL